MNHYRQLQYLLVAMMLPSLALGDSTESDNTTSAREKPSLITLMTGNLERVEDTEFIISRVEIPPHTSLPKHFHPGEEFVYVLTGRVILSQDEKDDMVFEEGDVGKVPLRQIHTARTEAEGAEILVFRVHETGQPERVLIDNPNN